jgi:hypothetical protein
MKKEKLKQMSISTNDDATVASAFSVGEWLHHVLIARLLLQDVLSPLCGQGESNPSRRLQDENGFLLY